MSKISLEIVDKIKVYNCSSLEIDFLLYLARISNEFGVVTSLYYKEVCLDLYMSAQSFYNILDSLAEKGLINVAEFRTWGAWDVTVNDNIYLTKKDYKSKAYLNTNRFGVLLYSREFKNLPVNIKYLILQLLKSQREGQNFKIGIQKLLGYASIKSETLLKKYLVILSIWFDIKRKNIIYYIKTNEASSTPGNRSEREYYLIHKIKSYCSSYKVSYTTTNLKDILILFKQYGKTKMNRLLAAISDICIEYHSIEPRAINSLINEKIK